MTGHSQALRVSRRHLLRQLGRRLVLARRARELTACAVARKIGISRNVVKAVERGDVSLGNEVYLQVASGLGMVGDLEFLGVELDEATGQLARRHESLEAQVLNGGRDARSLVAISVKLAQRARLTYPLDAFGTAQPW